MNCEQCLAPMSDSTRFCVNCGHARSSIPFGTSPQPSTPVQPLVSQAPVSQPPQPVFAAAPQTLPQVPTATTGVQLPSSQVRLAPGEVVMKTYPISGVTKGLGSLRGELTLTDVRVIYSAHAKNIFGESRNCRELQIADVNGVALVTRRGLTPLSFLTIVIALLVGLLLVSFLKSFLIMLTYRAGASSADFATFLLYALFIGIAGFLIYVRAKSTEVLFALFARNVDVSPISLSGSVGRQDAGFMAVSTAIVGGPLLAVMERLGILDAGDASDAADLTETQQMYDEIGALILDIQSRGVLGGKD